MKTVSLHQIRESLVRYVRDENQAAGRSVGALPVNTQVNMTQANPEPSATGIAQLKAWLRRIPVVAPILVTLYRLLKLPGRIALIVRQLEVLQGQVQGLARLHDRLDAINWHVASLEQRTSALTDRIEPRLQSIESRLQCIESSLHSVEVRLESEDQQSSATILRLVSDSAQMLVALHEKTDRYQQELYQRIRALKPVIHAGDNLVVSQVGDFVMAFPAEEWRLAAYEVFVGPLEPGLVSLMQRTIQHGMTVVDIGANVGTYTLLALQSVGEDGRVISYEPTPRAFDILKNNVQVNGFLESGRATLVQKAVSDGKLATQKLAVFRTSLTHNTLFPGVPDSDGEATFIDVETVALDDDLAELARIDVIKIDAEGAEPAILRGMQSLIERSPRITIFIEFAPMHLARAKEDPRVFIHELRRQGFRIEEVCEPRGELRLPTDDELCNCFSVNLMLRKAMQ